MRETRKSKVRLPAESQETWKKSDHEEDLLGLSVFSVHKVSPENVFEPISHVRLFLTAKQIAFDFFPVFS